MDNQKIVLFCGLPGSGKSTLSEAVAKELDLPLFSVDPIESAILEAGIKKSFQTGVAAYLVARSLAKEHIGLGKSVIIDAVNAEEEAKQVWRKLADETGCKLVIIEVFIADPAVHKKRIEARVRNLHGLPEVTWEHIVKRRREYGKWKEPVLSLDSTNATADNCVEAIRYITSAR